MTTLEDYQDDPAYPIIWELQESTHRDQGLEVLTIPCISKGVAMAYADKRAGRFLGFGQQQGVNQDWQDYGNLPRGRDYVRQVMAEVNGMPAVWQHIRVGFVITENRARW